MNNRYKRLRRLQGVFLIFMLLAFGAHYDGWAAIFGFVSVSMYVLNKIPITQNEQR